MKQQGTSTTHLSTSHPSSGLYPVVATLSLCSAETNFFTVSNIASKPRPKGQCPAFILHWTKWLHSVVPSSLLFLSHQGSLSLSNPLVSFSISILPSPLLLNIGFSMSNLPLVKHTHSHGLRCYSHSDVCQVYISNSHIFLEC